MFSVIRRNLNPPTFIALLALLFALTGGAFAATGGSGSGPAHVTLTAGAAKAKPKAKAGPRGPAGPKGATGAAGTTGPAGPTGPAGATGPAGPAGAGTPGTPGTPGANGTNGANGTEGKEGARGLKGVEGEPWTPNSTLPSGATETGVWSFGPLAPGTRFIFPAVASFTVQLAAPLSDSGCESKTTCQAHLIDDSAGGKEVGGAEEEHPVNCTGTVEKPTAKPGNLCVYIQEVNHATPAGVFMQSPSKEQGAQVTGAFGGFETASEGEAEGFGSWAVTAE
jgi:hypothetical protein